MYIIARIIMPVTLVVYLPLKTQGHVAMKEKLYCLNDTKILIKMGNEGRKVVVLP
jgi:hypothetical protein